jgi:hypothetical protein
MNVQPLTNPFVFTMLIGTKTRKHSRLVNLQIPYYITGSKCLFLNFPPNVVWNEPTLNMAVAAKVVCWGKGLGPRGLFRTFEDF